MGSSFTYEKPNDEKYHASLVKYLEFKGEKDLALLLNNAKCVIVTTTSFSHVRWDAFRAGVRFYVPLKKLSEVEPDSADKLLPFCQELMPADSGYDIMDVEFSPSIESAENIDASVSKIDETVTGLSREIMAAILPADLMQKGEEMAALYVYLYSIENALRLFIEIVAKSRYGGDYINNLMMSHNMKQKLSDRKADAARKRWLPSRGTSELFYLDFDDLGLMIQNNWELFKGYFPKLEWITTKVDELADCRNLVAHNSYLEEPQRNLVKTYYTTILMQLDSTMRELVTKAG